ncbi:MAG: sugar transferase, partial [Anaerolineae bacterium]
MRGGVRLQEMSISFQRFLKRATDIVVSVIGLALLAPVFLVIAAAIKLDSPGPVFFRQERVGKDGRIFRIFKFRTMVQNATE